MSDKYYKLKVFIYNIQKLIRENMYYLINYKKCNPKIDFYKVDKVVIVAHPDDELLFFSKLILNDKNLLIICMTNGGNYIRSNEFISFMNKIGADYKMLNFRDGLNIQWNKKKVIDKLGKILNKKEWKMIITHNDEGEYGHKQHKQLNNIINSLNLNNFYTPYNTNNLIKEKNKLSYVELKMKMQLAKEYYNSQYTILKDFKLYTEYEGVKCITIE